MPTSEEMRIWKQAEDVISAVEPNTVETKKNPLGVEARYFFMGGDLAGHILVNKKAGVNESGDQQLQLFYQFNKNDRGDYDHLTDLFNYIKAEGFDIQIPPQDTPRSKVDLGFTVFHRIFTLKDGALIVESPLRDADSAQQTKTVARAPWVITFDQALATDLFQKISSLPNHSQGRDLFALYKETVEKNQGKVELKSSDNTKSEFDFDKQDLEKSVTNGLSAIYRQMESTPLHFDEEQLEKFVADFEYLHKSKKWGRSWFLHFQGKIPMSWQWFDRAILSLREHQGPIPDDWIDAAVTHSHSGVLDEICERQLLNVEQFAIALGNMKPDSFDAEDALSNQRALGMSEVDINSALELAKKEGRNLVIKKLASS